MNHFVQVKMRQMCVSNNPQTLTNVVFSGIHIINLRNDLLHYKAIKARAGSTPVCLTVAVQPHVQAVWKHNNLIPEMNSLLLIDKYIFQ